MKWNFHMITRYNSMVELTRVISGKESWDSVNVTSFAPLSVCVSLYPYLRNIIMYYHGFSWKCNYHLTPLGLFITFIALNTSSFPARCGILKCINCLYGCTTRKKITAIELQTFSLKGHDHRLHPQNGHVHAHSQEPCWQCLSESQIRYNFVHNVSCNLHFPLVRLDLLYTQDVNLLEKLEREVVVCHNQTGPEYYIV